jgi:hypothetical protein
MNSKNKTCGSCCHFDDLRNVCQKFTVRYPFGKVYLTRLHESQICRTEYLPRPNDWQDTLSVNVDLKNY